MARPKKVGLDYFPMNVDFAQDDKVSLVIAIHGMTGLGVLVSLMSSVYKNGYYYNWTEREQIVFSSNVKVDIEETKAIVNDAIKWGFFNKDMFENFHILTSKGFQERYTFAVGRRVDCRIKEEHLLIEQKEEKQPEKVVNAAEKIVSVNRNPVNEDNMFAESTQKKRKEIKDIKDLPEKEREQKEKMKKLLSRYKEGFAAINNAYWEVIKETRTTKKISKSVILRNTEVWGKYDPIVVEYALKAHTLKYAGRREEYTIGIMRGTTKEEAEQRIQTLGQAKQTGFKKQTAKEEDFDLND